MLLGTSSASENVLTEQVTDTMTSSAAVVQPDTTDEIYVTVTCVNQLNYRSFVSVEPTRFLGQPPGSADAVVDVIPEQQSVWQPGSNSQIAGPVVAFNYRGFSDVSNVEYYQYMLQYGDSSTEWISVGKQVS